MCSLSSIKISSVSNSWTQSSMTSSFKIAKIIFLRIGYLAALYRLSTQKDGFLKDTTPSWSSVTATLKLIVMCQAFLEAQLKQLHSFLHGTFSLGIFVSSFVVQIVYSHTNRFRERQGMEAIRSGRFEVHLDKDRSFSNFKGQESVHILRFFDAHVCWRVFHRLAQW